MRQQKLQLKWIRLDKINFPSPSLRISPNKKKLAELKKSIQEKGIIYPVVCRGLGKGEYALVAGEQRVRECNELGFSPSYLVPAIVIDANDPQAIEYGLIENLVRQELTPFEEANALHLLTKTYGYKKIDLARKIGKTRGYVSDLLSIFALPSRILTALRKGRLTVAHGRLLVKLNNKPQLQRKVFQHILDDNLSKDETEILVNSTLLGKSIPSFYKAQVWQLKDGSRVRIEPRRTGTRIELFLDKNGSMEQLLQTVKLKVKKALSRR